MILTWLWLLISGFDRSTKLTEEACSTGGWCTCTSSKINQFIVYSYGESQLSTDLVITISDQWSSRPDILFSVFGTMKTKGGNRIVKIVNGDLCHFKSFLKSVGWMVLVNQSTFHYCFSRSLFCLYTIMQSYFSIN